MHCSQECPWVKLLDWDSKEMRETRLILVPGMGEAGRCSERRTVCLDTNLLGPAGLRAVSLWGFAYTITQSRQLHKRRGCLLPHINRTCKQVFASAEGEFYIGCSKTKQENSCSIGSNCIPSILCEAVKSGGGKERLIWHGKGLRNQNQPHGLAPTKGFFLGDGVEHSGFSWWKRQELVPSSPGSFLRRYQFSQGSHSAWRRSTTMYMIPSQNPLEKTVYREVTQPCGSNWAQEPEENVHTMPDIIRDASTFKTTFANRC